MAVADTDTSSMKPSPGTYVNVIILGVLLSTFLRLTKENAKGLFLGMLALG